MATAHQSPQLNWIHDANIRYKPIELTQQKKEYANNFFTIVNIRIYWLLKYRFCKHFFFYHSIVILSFDRLCLYWLCQTFMNTANNITTYWLWYYEIYIEPLSGCFCTYAVKIKRNLSVFGEDRIKSTSNCGFWRLLICLFWYSLHVEFWITRYKQRIRSCASWENKRFT